MAVSTMKTRCTGCFNTDDGIWRATINVINFNEVVVNVVSIPMTVFGGLQYCAPEPLGLLAPDE